MATSHNYDIATELGGETDLMVLLHRVLADGTYTGPSVSGVDADTIMVTVAENSVPKATLETILTTAAPTISLDKSTVTITPDGVDTDTITVTDSRGASASGKIVKLRWNGLLYTDANSLTLNASGQGTVTLGPCPSGQCTSSFGVLVHFIHEDVNVVQKECLVKFE